MQNGNKSQQNQKTNHEKDNKSQQSRRGGTALNKTNKIITNELIMTIQDVSQK